MDGNKENKECQDDSILAILAMNFFGRHDVRVKRGVVYHRNKRVGKIRATYANKGSYDVYYKPDTELQYVKMNIVLKGGEQNDDKRID